MNLQDQIEGLGVAFDQAVAIFGASQVVQAVFGGSWVLGVGQPCDADTYDLKEAVE